MTWLGPCRRPRLDAGEKDGLVEDATDGEPYAPWKAAGVEFIRTRTAGGLACLRRGERRAPGAGGQPTAQGRAHSTLALGHPVSRPSLRRCSHPVRSQPVRPADQWRPPVVVLRQRALPLSRQQLGMLRPMASRTRKSPTSRRDARPPDAAFGSCGTWTLPSSRMRDQRSPLSLR